MNYIKIPLFNHARTYEADELSGIYSEEGEHGYVYDADASHFIGKDTMDVLRHFVIDVEEDDVPYQEATPFLSTNEPEEPKPPVETVSLLEALDGLTKLADAMRSDGQTFPNEPTVIQVPKGIEEGS